MTTTWHDPIGPHISITAHTHVADESIRLSASNAIKNFCPESKQWSRLRAATRTHANESDDTITQIGDPRNVPPIYDIPHTILVVITLVDFLWDSTSLTFNLHWYVN